MAIGPCPLRRIILTGRTTEVRRMMHYAFEKATKIVQDLQAEGKPIEDGIIIGDLNNFSWREHACLACAYKYFAYFLFREILCQVFLL